MPVYPSEQLLSRTMRQGSASDQRSVSDVAGGTADAARSEEVVTPPGAEADDVAAEPVKMRRLRSKEPEEAPRRYRNPAWMKNHAVNGEWGAPKLFALQGGGPKAFVILVNGCKCVNGAADLQTAT